MKTKVKKQKEFNGQIEYLDINYLKDNDSVIITTDRIIDNTSICLHIDLHSFLKCVSTNKITELKNQLIKNVKSL